MSAASVDDDTVLDDDHAPDSSVVIDVTPVVPKVRLEETHVIDMEGGTSYVSEDLQEQLLCSLGYNATHGGVRIIIFLASRRRLDTIIDDDDTAATILRAFAWSSALQAIFLRKTKASIVIQSIF